MPGASRLGDKSYCPACCHGCPACAHPVSGPAVGGSPNVLINNKPALRVSDPGVHSSCCGPNIWNATKGSSTVIINGLQAMRRGDVCTHCGGTGKMIEASTNVFIGDNPGSMSPGPAVNMIASALRSITHREKGTNESPEDYLKSDAANIGAAGAGANTGGNVAGDNAAAKNCQPFANENADHLAPERDLNPKISAVKWDKPSVSIGTAVSATFKYSGFKAGDKVTLRINRIDGNGSKNELESNILSLTSTEGEFSYIWNRTKQDVKADLQEGKLDGDNSALNYNFEVEANGTTIESGSLNFTQTINVKPKDHEGNLLADGVEINLTTADGKKLSDVIKDGEVVFKNVIVGPVDIQIG